jgi:hypothetical protein
MTELRGWRFEPDKFGLRADAGGCIYFLQVRSGSHISRDFHL